VFIYEKHFEDLYSTRVDNSYQEIFTSKLLNYSVDTNDLLFTVYDVTDAVGKQELHKAAGPDGMQMEAFIYGCHRLHVYLSVMFNIFAKYGYITSEFCRAGIIALVKNKNGNLTDVNNYRALAISNAFQSCWKNLYCNIMILLMKLTTISLLSKKVFRLVHVRMLLSRLFNIIDSVAVTCSAVSSISVNVNYWLQFCKLLD